MTEEKPQKVKVLQTQGQSALVEWYDKDAELLRRAYVPNNELSNGTCSLEVLDSGIPYGLPWAKFLEIQMTPESLERELRRIGLWTLDDFASKGPQVFGAINRSTGVNLSKLKQAAVKYLEDKEG